MWLLDTSVLVAAFTSENDTTKAQAWLALHDREAFISPWNIVEFASALSMKVRRGYLSESDHLRCQSAFAAYVDNNAFVLPISRRHFEAAAILCASGDFALKAADAMHIALAREIGAGLATLDRQQQRAAVLSRVPLAAL